MMDIKAIRGRVDKASEGPWEHDQNTCYTGQIASFHGDEQYGYSVVWTRKWGEQRIFSQFANAEFVAHAREDIPALLDALEDCLNALEHIHHACLCETCAALAEPPLAKYKEVV